MRLHWIGGDGFAWLQQIGGYPEQRDVRQVWAVGKEDETQWKRVSKTSGSHQSPGWYSSHSSQFHFSILFESIWNLNHGIHKYLIVRQFVTMFVACFCTHSLHITIQSSLISGLTHTHTFICSRKWNSLKCRNDEADHTVSDKINL